MTTANNPVVTAELLPCPFCGSGEGSQQIVGKIVRCSCGSSMEAAQESWAISAWNTRAMTEASPPPDEPMLTAEEEAELVERINANEYLQPSLPPDVSKLAQRMVSIANEDTTSGLAADALREGAEALQSIGPLMREKDLDETVAAGAKQMRMVLDHGYDDETAFYSALESTGLDAALKSIGIEGQG